MIYRTYISKAVLVARCLTLIVRLFVCHSPLYLRASVYVGAREAPHSPLLPAINEEGAGASAFISNAFQQKEKKLISIRSAIVHVAA